MIRGLLFGLLLVASGGAEVIPAGAKVYAYDTNGGKRAVKALAARKVPVQLVPGAEADYAFGMAYFERESASSYTWSGSAVCHGPYCSGSGSVKENKGGPNGRYTFASCFVVNLHTGLFVWGSHPVGDYNPPRNENDCAEAFRKVIGQPLPDMDRSASLEAELTPFLKLPPPTPAQLADKSAAERMRVLREEIEALKRVQYTAKADPARLAELEREFLALWEARSK